MFVLCFISQWMKGSKHGLFFFPLKKTLIWRRYCSIGQLCYSMMSKQIISWFVESSWWRLLNQPKARRVCIYSINQSNHYFCLFVVSVLLAHFHFKVIQKSFYQYKTCLHLGFIKLLDSGSGKNHSVTPVILLPLCPVSLMHKNPQRCK